jgi:thymidylate kinase
VLNNIPKPDVVLYFSLPFAVTARRIQEEKDAGKAIDILEQSEQYIRNSHSAGEFYAQLFDWSVVNCTTEKDGVVYERTQEEIRDEVFRILIKRLP